MKILVVNAGSSSDKLAIYSLENPLPKEAQTPLWQGTIEWSGTEAKLTTQNSNETLAGVDRRQAITRLLENVKKSHLLSSLGEIDIVAHRVVHGGSEFQQPTLITSSVKQAIANLIPLAPLHNPVNLEGIEISEELIPHARQFAVFDTAFHSTLSDAASTYPGPYHWKELLIKRYGFHGISHQYCSERCAELLNRKRKSLKIVTCHLGNGCSLAAIDQGKSLDTTMGFTPIEGLMMGSRSGSIDPGILIFLQQQKNQSADSLFQTLNFESGLKGISGKSNDMREIIHLSSEGDPRARLAYRMFVHHLKRNMGAMIAVLGGVDAIVFTAGIGENSPQIRQEACASLAQLGVILDEHKNETCRPDAVISSPQSRVQVLVIKTQEDWCIAKETLKAIQSEK